MFGFIHWVQNLDKKTSSASLYWRVLVKGENGLETLLLTESELKRCRERAAKNPEDVIIPTLWDRVRAFIAF